MGIEIPAADPDGLENRLQSYDRCQTTVHPGEWPKQGWGSKRGGQVNFVTSRNNVSRVMKDLYGSMNIVQYGYIVTSVREIKSPKQKDTKYGERDDVHRIVLEPLGKFLIYAQYGHHSPVTGSLKNKAPSKP